MACQFFMVTAEGTYGPRLPSPFSFFYMHQQRGFRRGIFLSTSPIANYIIGLALVHSALAGSTVVRRDWI
jgi:hypothetical protein